MQISGWLQFIIRYEETFIKKTSTDRPSTYSSRCVVSECVEGTFFSKCWTMVTKENLSDRFERSDRYVLPLSGAGRGTGPLRFGRFGCAQCPFFSILLEQNNLLCFEMRGSLEYGEISSARLLCGIPVYAVRTGVQAFVHQHRDFATEYVENSHADHL